MMRRLRRFKKFSLISLNLHGKLMLSFLLLVVLIASAGGYSLTQHERQTRLTELDGKASRIAELLSAVLDQPLWNVDKAQIDAILDTLASNPDVVELTIFDEKFGVLSSVSSKLCDDPRDYVIREKPIFHAASGSVPRERLGQVRIILSKARVEREIWRAQLAILASMTVQLLTLYVAIFVILRSAVHRPINRLKEAIDSIANGKLEVDCPVDSTDELGELALRINSMAHRLRISTTRLRESEIKYRRIFENAIEGIFLLRRDGRLFEANPAMLRLLGYQATDYLIHDGSRNTGTLVFSPTQTRLMFEAAATGREIVGFEMQIFKQDGTPIWVEMNARSIADGSGQPEFIEGLLADVTERRRARERLQRQRDRLEREVAERRRAEVDLLASREQLRQLSAHMEEIRESDRKHIAMMIHDELGQLLTALKIDVSLLTASFQEDGAEWRRTCQMLEVIEKTLQIVRDVASHLRPAALNYGLASALEWLASDYTRRGGTPCGLHIVGGEPELPEAHATAIFRIAQEALTNVARHAEATCLELRLVNSESRIELIVVDNGSGFDLSVARTKGSYGLLGMAERARLIGANLSIESACGAGSVIHLQLEHNAINQTADLPKVPSLRSDV
ncbi:PAS domain S-box protein [Burkholderia ubonensis]|uniref:PAS domain S-box protein n=1 Tax=Burkholderia ubonensis TaxID=101571 RepID=UPI000A8256DC|nr:PAS domain S-box protein [Burkholderia ubonensis]